MILQTYKNYIMRLDLFVISGIFDYVAQSLSQRKLPIQINPYLRQDNRALKHLLKLFHSNLYPITQTNT